MSSKFLPLKDIITKEEEILSLSNIDSISNTNTIKYEGREDFKSSVKYKYLKHKYNDIKKMMYEYEKDLKNKNTKIETLISKLKAKDEHIVCLTTEISELKLEIDSITKNNLKEFEGLKKENYKVIDKCNNYKSDNLKLKQRITSLENDNKKLKDNCDNANLKLDKIDKMLINFTELQDEYKKELQNINNERNGIISKNNKLEFKNSENNKIISEFMNKEIAYNNQLKILKEELNKINSSKENLEYNYNLLTNKNKEVKHNCIKYIHNIQSNLLNYDNNIIDIETLIKNLS